MKASIDYFLSYCHYFRMLPVITCFFYCLACNETSSLRQHPDFINMALKKMDTAQNKEQAIIFIDAAFKELYLPGMEDEYIKDSIFCHYYGYIKPTPLKTIAYADTILALLKENLNENRNAERYAYALEQKAGSLLALQRFHEYFYTITEQEVVALKYIKDPCLVTHYTDTKAYSLFVQDKFRESASAYLRHYHQLLSSCGDGYHVLMQLQSSLNNAGECYLRLGVLDSAAWYENEALKIIATAINKYPEKNDFSFYAKAVIMADQAEVLARRGHYTEAEALYTESIAGTKVKDVAYTQATLGRLAAVYLNDSEAPAAKKTLTELKISLDTLPSKKLHLTWKRLMSDYFKQTNNPDSAFAYRQQYETLNDTLVKQETVISSNDIASAFENLELRYAHETLRKESKIKNLWIFGSVILFLAIAAIALFVWTNLKRTRKLHLLMKQKNEDMQIAFASLEKSHQEHNRIMRIVAHDLKTPVSSINNLVFAMLRKNLPEDLKEIFELIKKASSNSMVLINDALQQKKKAAVIRKELVDMKRLLEYCVDLLQAKASEKNQQLNLQAEDVSAMLNRQKMWRVIGNIVNNAIKFSPAHTVINIRLQKKGNCILLSVQDKGIGIPESLKEKIFTMSPEVSREGTFGEASYGMGLSISRKLVEEHEGKIWFESDAGQGAVFYIELPCQN